MLRSMLGQKRYHPSEEPPEWLRSAWGGWETDSGMEVTPDSALQVTAWLACVRILSEVVASLPYITYRRLKRGKERATDHYLYPILHDIANPEMSAFTFRQLLTAHELTRGNGLAEIEFNKAGGINALWPLDPDKTELQRDPATKKLYYIVTLPERVGGNKVRLAAERVFHIKWLTGNGLWGLSPTWLARNTLGMSMATEKHAATFFANGAEPGILLKTPQGVTLDDDAYTRLQNDWEDMHQGLDKAHRVAILEDGMSVEKLSMTQDDAQWLQTTKMGIANIGRIFGISLDMLNEDGASTTYASVEQFTVRFRTFTLMSHTTRWDSEVNRTLLAPGERGSIFVEHLLDALMRGDSASRWAAYTAGFQTGVNSPNDILEAENRNPFDGGDQHFIMSNMMPIEKAATQPAS